MSVPLSSFVLFGSHRSKASYFGAERQWLAAQLLRKWIRVCIGGKLHREHLISVTYILTDPAINQQSPDAHLLYPLRSDALAYRFNDETAASGSEALAAGRQQLSSSAECILTLLAPLVVRFALAGFEKGWHPQNASLH